MASRSKGLDILRAIAVILVMGRHMEICPSEYSSFFNRITFIWNRGGGVGVDLFFVLSGFLISGLLFSEHKLYNRISFKHFFIRRGFKIYPPFYVLIAVAVIVSAVFSAHRINNRSLVSELFFMQDFARGIFDHTWSLAVEEKFYLLLPLLLIGLCKINRTKQSAFGLIPVIFVFVGLAVLIFRFLARYVIQDGNFVNLYQFSMRIDSLFFGVLIAYFYHYYPAIFMKAVRDFRYMFLVLGIILLMPAFIFEIGNTAFIQTFGLTLFYLGGGLILMSVIDKNFNDNLFMKTISFVGLNSYSIYLWNIPMAIWGISLAKRFLPYWNWGIYIIVYFFGSIFIGIFMAKMVELQTLKLRDRLYPSRSKPLFEDKR